MSSPFQNNSAVVILLISVSTPSTPFAQILPYLMPYLRIFVSTPVVEKTKTQALGGFFHKSKNLSKIAQNRMFFREMIHILSFLLANIVKNRNFYIQNFIFQKF